MLFRSSAVVAAALWAPAFSAFWYLSSWLHSFGLWAVPHAVVAALAAPPFPAEAAARAEGASRLAAAPVPPVAHDKFPLAAAPTSDRKTRGPLLQRHHVWLGKTATETGSEAGRSRCTCAALRTQGKGMAGAAVAELSADRVTRPTSVIPAARISPIACMTFP